jgi:hypothetical protein
MCGILRLQKALKLRSVDYPQHDGGTVLSQR